MNSIKYLLASLLLLWGFTTTTQAQSDINLTGYTLSFDDEFNSLSATTTSPKGSSTWYAQPLNSAGYYSESTWDITAMSTSGGILNDTAFLDSNNNWHSGELLSIDPTTAGFTQTYGYFEIRCQMPNSGDGAWPAFWLDTTSGVTGGANEEVDIFEWYGICNTAGSYQDLVQETSHNWNSDGSQNTTTAPYLQSTSTAIPNGTYPWQGYHIYGCQIDPVHMTWYIDGVQTNQCATPTTYLATPFFVELDYALGGGWPLSGMVNNSSFAVDWVRVYSLPSAPPASTSIGVQFVGQGTAMASTDSAGVPAVAQTNWKPLTGSTFSGVALNDSTGAATTASLSGSSDGAYFSGSSFASGTGNYKLCTGELYDGAITTETNSLTVSSIPYSQYDVYVYGECDSSTRSATFTITPSGGTASSLSFQTESNGSAWTAGTSTWNGSGTAPTLSVGNYVHFTGLTASSFTLKFGGVNNVGMNGIQIVKTSSTSTYALTVNSGTGSGTYAAGTQVTVTANAPQSGYQFAGWTGATSALANSSASTTTLTMPAAATSITATYSAIPTYALTVTNGTGSGSYTAGTQVTVTANAPQSGYQFAGWTGATSALANASAGTTTLTMPAAATAITATYSATGSNLITNGTYKVVSQSSGLAMATTGTTNASSVVQQTYTSAATQQWTLTNLGNNVVEMVSSGTSEALEVPGSSTSAGTALDVSSYTGATNQQWTIVTASTGYYEVVNVNSGEEVNVAGNSTTSGAVLCQWFAGNYGNGVWSFTSTGAPPTYALTVNSGTGSGSYAAGTQVTVTANAPQTGYQFSAWTGATSALASTTAATTTLTMPAAATSITATYSTTGGILIGNGTYKVISQSSSLALAASGTSNASAVVQQTYTAAATQKWTLTNLGSNVVELVSSGTSEALEVPGSSTSAGTSLDISSYAGGTNQQWTIITASTGYYEVVNVNSGEEVNVANNSTTSGTAICQWYAGNYGNGVWAFMAP